MNRNGIRKESAERRAPGTGAKPASRRISSRQEKDRPGKNRQEWQEKDRRKKEKMERERRLERRALRRERRAREVRRQWLLLAAGILAVLFVVAAGTQLVSKAYADSNLSEEVLAYRDTLEKYAEKAGVSDYVDTLLAIMMVESEGRGNDVMQASESLGLEPGSLEPEASIEQACIYFAALVETEANLGIDDDKALIQAYNFGPGYLFYLAENGKKHRQSLAIEYAKEQSGGEKVRYLHLYAIKKNGGWIYKFGNMFYDALVQQYL